LQLFDAKLRATGYGVVFKLTELAEIGTENKNRGTGQI
jgi:hypothetical protein